MFVYKLTSFHFHIDSTSLLQSRIRVYNNRINCKNVSLK